MGWAGQLFVDHIFVHMSVCEAMVLVLQGIWLLSGYRVSAFDAVQFCRRFACDAALC